MTGFGLVGELRQQDEHSQSADLIVQAFEALVKGVRDVADLALRRQVWLAVDPFGVAAFGEGWTPIGELIPPQAPNPRPLYTRLDLADEAAPFQRALAMLQLAILMAPSYALADSLYAPVEALYDAFGIPNPADRQAHPEHYPTVAPSVLRQLEMHFDFPERPDYPKDGAA